MTRRSARWSLSSTTTLRPVNNIVLTPSENESAFDSFKIGNARVHRYAREDDPDSEVEYVMWYHGRSQAMHANEKELPPLSTGRIGRATSKNGLVWIKDGKGSDSEDVPDVSLGLNKDSWWGFDVAHLGLGSVLMPMSTPAVLTEGGVYLMYYHGGNDEQSLIQDFMERKVPEALQGSMVKGMRMRIGVAVSQDGVTWGRVEGDHPSGAVLVPFERNDRNSMENAPEDMPEELYCAWPEVVLNVRGDESSRFLMFYSTMLKETKEKCIAYAISPDGFRWTKKGVCVRPDGKGLDAAGCARCSVRKDAFFDEGTGSWKELSTWKMFFEGVSKEDGKHRVMVAESRDGLSWTKHGMVLDVGAEGSWDSEGVGSPHVVL